MANSGSHRLVTKFLSNDILMLHLQVCLILNFDLLHNTAIHSPFMARVDIGIEPSDIIMFFKMYTGASDDIEKVEGMFQVNAVTPIQPHTGPVEGWKMDIWRRIREETTAAGFASDAVVLVDFVKPNENTITVPVHIQLPAKILAQRAEPFQKISTLTGDCREVPMSPVACIEFINMHIRSDAFNQLRLRTDMTHADLEVIKGASRGEDTKQARILKDKIAREPVYQPLL